MSISITIKEEDVKTLYEEALRRWVEQDARELMILQEPIRSGLRVREYEEWFVNALDEALKPFLEDNKELIIKGAVRSLMKSFDKKDVIAALLLASEQED